MTDSEGIQQLRQEFVTVENGLSTEDFDFIVAANGDHPDLHRLRRLLRRRQLGEPREYVVGFQQFRGRRFAVDKRVYITDPELTHLVDAVTARAREILETEKRPPVIVEFGVGCGSLAISVKKEVPKARVIGLDLDGDAIVVARDNANHHHADIWLMESDLFSGLPTELVPDIVFGDPPWGDDDSIYDDDRPASHYHAMPPLSAFPTGGITGLHEAILKDIAKRVWVCAIFLNLGILKAADRDRLTAMTATSEILSFDKASVLLCMMSKLPKVDQIASTPSRSY